MIAFWTIIHGIVAIALLGAITHQALTVWRKPAPATKFVDRFRSVTAVHFTNAVAVAYVISFALGSYIYPAFVLDVKQSIADYGMRKTIGVFQLKEHLAVIGLGILPVYWHYWRTVPLNEGVHTRRLLTTLLMLIVWWNLVVGLILNNVKGLI